MKYHTLSFSKIKKVVAKVYIVYIAVVMGSIIHMSLNVMCMESKIRNLLFLWAVV